MSSEDNFSDGVVKPQPRPVLSDVTNLRAKRPFSSISADDGDSRFTKKKVQSKLGVQAQQGRSNKDKVVVSQQKGQNPCLELPFCGDDSLGNVSSQESNLQLPSGGLEEKNLLGGAVVSGPTEVPVAVLGEIGQGRPLNEGFIDRGIESGQRDVRAVDNLGSPKCGGRAVELPTMSDSCDSRFPGLERCSVLQGNAGPTSAAAAADLLKSCTCSFCSKAAHIWSDLHYQDVKGRLSALKKSQKDASNAVQKLSEIKDSVMPDQQSSSESSKLELALMHQWKSLFDFMENTFAEESRQLESSFETLKDLRDNCKNDLDSTDNTHFDNH
ncbi:uncharacterized protein LOC130715383 [Lotus japonicus]|uniref:uncharacterized protein LOC130715383 n=1 Tax=Lotus japonicus TaxID=34305 RepID=UPI00258A6EA9|nr:uncharacterized protein LOC130715383 [Lotus japonicus]XP_057421461.1 uncharacterized protein LOC130715383 [Lotus japonicus]